MLARVVPVAGLEGGEKRKFSVSRNSQPEEKIPDRVVLQYKLGSGNCEAGEAVAYGIAVNVRPRKLLLTPMYFLISAGLRQNSSHAQFAEDSSESYIR